MWGVGGTRTREYRPLRSSCVILLPFWSISSNGPPTLGLPTPLVDSAILLRCIRSFSRSKYHTRPAPVMTKSRPAFHEKGCRKEQRLAADRGCDPRMTSKRAYPGAIPALGLLHRLVLEPALHPRLVGRRMGSRGARGGRSPGLRALRGRQRSQKSSRRRHPRQGIEDGASRRGWLWHGVGGCGPRGGRIGSGSIQAWARSSSGKIS